MGLSDRSWTPARIDAGNATPSWRDDNRNTVQTDLDTTPAMETPSGIMSERDTKGSGGDPEKEPIDTSLSLDQFQARYTSEDNASFMEIVERINAQKREKYRWLYEQGKKKQLLIENGPGSDQKLLREAGEIDGQVVSSTSTDAETEENSKLALVVKDTRPGTITTWEFNVS